MGRAGVKLGFAMPHMVRLKATMQPWEAEVTGADQTRLAKWAEKLGYEMIAVPEHHIIPREHVDLSGPHYFNAFTAMAHFAGATETIRVNSLHGQGVLDPGKRVVIEGIAEDGTVEAIRIADAPSFALGVQWHAEYDPHKNEINKTLFKAFGDALLKKKQRRG